MADIEYEIGSGNVFADICCDEPDEALVTAELAAVWAASSNIVI